MAQSAQFSNATLPISTEISIGSQSIINQLVDFFPSNPIYYSILANIIFGLFLINMTTREEGCLLDNGLYAPDGWEKLFNNCQEKCVCSQNYFYCIPNRCDLNKNKCIADDFGYSHCQGAVFVMNTRSQRSSKPIVIDLNGSLPSKSF